ncbi:zinc-binding dehydrogenase [Candidatus Thiodictyon syntrophicum]|jgi:NADPH-dependent curcumin reductase CurA|uniref:Oxidoreductase N-terminal domain-containing protein n=1 Tax=Candidatus Thiodictyon syntrophicum TaxID=1166950 RepID=A0A2K8U8G2_9GAMM|nr:zinc-binding dehydrogenase [Candidatus Thiodictyon syntrophicum]AUB81870.1 hypothetical protein THSYN_13480 [Candidatus Thiodictyon syntrophicum]
MSQSPTVNRRIVLNARPIGVPTAKDFRIESGPVPQPEPGQVLLRTLYLSLDPYMRGRMSDAPSYAPPVAIGDPMVGGTVSRVEVSRHGDYTVGDLVLGYTGWQDYALPAGPDRLGLLVGTLLRKRIKMQGFIVFDDYGPRWGEFAGAMGEWVQQGKVKVREDMVFGLENAPEAFIGLLQGKNFGKLVIALAHDTHEWDRLGA